MVTKRRLELPRPHWPAGFKPAASTYSAILPYSIITLMFINHVAKILTFIGMCKSLCDFLSYFNIYQLFHSRVKPGKICGLTFLIAYTIADFNE